MYYTNAAFVFFVLQRYNFTSYLPIFSVYYMFSLTNNSTKRSVCACIFPNKDERKDTHS